MVEIKGCNEDGYLISGYCRVGNLTELQRFILRYGAGRLGVGLYVTFTPVSKSIIDPSFGSYFTFMMGSKPNSKDLDFLEEICGYLFEVEKLKVD